MKLNFLLTKVFGAYARRNLTEDFEKMAKTMNLSNDPELREICFTWFSLGHVNSADKSSSFVTKQFGEADNKKVH